MKHLSFRLKEIRQQIIRGSIISTVQICIFSLVFVFLVISCGPLPTSEINVPETTTNTTEKTTNMQTQQINANLPESATVDLQKIPYLSNAFKQSPPDRSRLALANFHSKMRQLGHHSALLSNCSVDVLKAFIANGWAPIVMIQLQSRNPIVSPVVHYDNNSSMVHLQNPNSASKRRLSYEEFDNSWGKSSQKRCVIITPKRLTKADVEKVLNQYSLTDAFQQISMSSF